VLKHQAGHVQARSCLKALKAWGAIDLADAVAIAIKQQVDTRDIEVQGGG
jgi:hypothetical protein